MPGFEGICPGQIPSNRGPPGRRGLLACASPCRKPAPPPTIAVESPSLLSDAYLATLGLLGVYGLHRLTLLRHFRWQRSEGQPPAGEEEFVPTVTVQLPLYNERAVAARLIRAVGELDWPADALEIQVLDDSTDETRRIVDAEVERLRERGLDAKVVRRPDRSGYKAGALDYGMARARG
ncbi:MAG TPA: glycosyltransferase, partial [Planctomycetes bacterium]|nr:glycosyltransferase [Planctomycetota bacterium]